MTAAWSSGRSASNCDAARPWWRRACAARRRTRPGRPGGGRPSTTVRHRRRTSARVMAWPSSLVAPSTRTDWTSPRPSFTGDRARSRARRGPTAGRRPDRAGRAPPATRRGAGTSPRTRPGVEAGVLGQVDAAAGVGHEAVEAVEHAAPARRCGRQVDGQRPARDAGTTAARRCRGPKRFSTVRNDATRAPRRRSRTRRSTALGAVGHGALPLHEAAPAVEPVPAGDGVEGVEERGDRLHARRRGAGAPSGSGAR